MPSRNCSILIPSILAHAKIASRSKNTLSGWPLAVRVAHGRVEDRPVRFHAELQEAKNDFPARLEHALCCFEIAKSLFVQKVREHRKEADHVGFFVHGRKR